LLQVIELGQEKAISLGHTRLNVALKSEKPVCRTANNLPLPCVEASAYKAAVQNSARVATQKKASHSLSNEFFMKE